MTYTQQLPVGDRTRSLAAAAIASSVLAAAAFVAFAAVTTQLKEVRAGSPWQNDPYNTVVSFSEFAVPALAVSILLRCTLNRHHDPVPRFRVEQLVRGSVVCTVLIAGTAVVDWIGVAVLADRALWDGTTRWLIGALAAISALAAVGLLLGSRAARTLRPVAHSGTGGDWLDDARELLRRNGLGRLLSDQAVGLVRRHLLPAAGLLSLIAAGGVVGASAVGEGWTDPALIGYTLGVAWTSYFAFCLICNAAMRIAARPPISQLRHAVEISAIAGCLGVQVAVAFNNSIPAMLGRRGDTATVGQLVVVTAAVAVVAAGITFGVMVARPRFGTAALYAAYARRLRKQVVAGPLPRHIGLIMDGNRRWARQAGLANPSLGHRYGAEHLKEVLSWCRAVGIDHVTVFICSTENLQRRDHDEVAFLMRVVAEMVTAEMAHSDSHWKVHIAGTLDAVPVETARVLQGALAATADVDTGAHVTLAVGYGGRLEVIDAMRALLAARAAAGETLAQLAEELTADDIAAHLYTAGMPDPDLVIRTSGEQRLSNFLLWQSAYAELYFCEAYWPAFREIDLLRALRNFAARDRRYGG